MTAEGMSAQLPQAAIGDVGVSFKVRRFDEELTWLRTVKAKVSCQRPGIERLAYPMVFR